MGEHPYRGHSPNEHISCECDDKKQCQCYAGGYDRARREFSVTTTDKNPYVCTDPMHDESCNKEAAVAWEEGAAHEREKTEELLAELEATADQSTLQRDRAKRAERKLEQLEHEHETLRKAARSLMVACDHVPLKNAAEAPARNMRAKQEEIRIALAQRSKRKPER